MLYFTWRWRTEIILSVLMSVYKCFNKEGRERERKGKEEGEGEGEEGEGVWENGIYIYIWYIYIYAIKRNSKADGWEKKKKRTGGRKMTSGESIGYSRENVNWSLFFFNSLRWLVLLILVLLTKLNFWLYWILSIERELKPFFFVSFWRYQVISTYFEYSTFISGILEKKSLGKKNVCIHYVGLFCYYYKRVCMNCALCMLYMQVYWIHTSVIS